MFGDSAPEFWLASFIYIERIEMSNYISLTVAMTFVGLGSIAFSTELSECRQITEDQARLSCYDAIEVQENVAAGQFVYDHEAVKADCADMFPNDFATQKFCINQNEQGFDDFVNIVATAPSGAQGALEECANMFPNDWSTANFCAKQQVAAFNDLN